MKAFQALAAAAATLLVLSSAVATAKPKTSGPAALRHMQSVKKAMPKSTKTKALRSECVNFEAKWHGTCVDSDNETWDDDITIEQDRGECEYVSIWGIDFPIGGGALLGATSPTDMSSGVGFADWNGSGNILRLRVQYSGRGLGTDSFFYTGNGDDDFQLVNGQLIYRSVSLSTYDSGGQHGQTQYWETCTYDKVAESR